MQIGTYFGIKKKETSFGEVGFLDFLKETVSVSVLKWYDYQWLDSECPITVLLVLGYMVADGASFLLQ